MRELLISTPKLWRKFPADILATGQYLLLTRGRRRAYFQLLALGEDGEPFFPEVDQGCYYFRDRHGESQDPTDESGLFNRGSWNFTLAIYDSQTGTLYYYELDT